MGKKGMIMGYDSQFKEEAVQQLLTSGKSRQQLSNELGVSAWSLSQWKRASLEVSGAVPVNPNRKPGFSGAVKATKGCALEAAEAEIHELRRELGRVQRQRDLLKKAIAICSQDELNTDPPLGDQQPEDRLPSA